MNIKKSIISGENKIETEPDDDFSENPNNIDQLLKDLEKQMDFKMMHGECVALGCVAAAFISWKRQLISMEEYYEIRDMFVPFNIPISIEGIDKEAVLELIKSDKKADSDRIKFVLLKKIGKAFIDDTVTREEMSAALDEIIYVENGD